MPENQGIFSALTVEETLNLAKAKSTGEAEEKMEWMLDLFPDLKKYWRKKSGLLSGGQKQMLAIARAYINGDGLLLIDEPSKGLSTVQEIDEERRILTLLTECFNQDGKLVLTGTAKMMVPEDGGVI